MLTGWNVVCRVFPMVMFIQQESSNLVDAVHELINILQGTPYKYDEDSIGVDEDQPSQDTMKQPCYTYVFECDYLNHFFLSIVILVCN